MGLFYFVPADISTISTVGILIILYLFKYNTKWKKQTAKHMFKIMLIWGAKCEPTKVNIR